MADGDDQEPAPARGAEDPLTGRVDNTRGSKLLSATEGHADAIQPENLVVSALTDQAALDRLITTGRLALAPTLAKSRITDWNGLTPEEEQKRREADYERAIEEVRARSEELMRRLDEQEREVRKKIAEADARAIVLLDGRRVLVGRNGAFVDEETRSKLEGGDADEARKKQRPDSETQEEHDALRTQLGDIESARENLHVAQQKLSPGASTSDRAEAAKEIANAESTLHDVNARLNHLETDPEAIKTISSTDTLTALGLGSSATRSTSYIASLEGKDSCAPTPRNAFGAAAKDADPPPSPSAQPLTTLSDSVSRVEVIEVQQQYKAQSPNLIPKCFRNLRTQGVRFGRLFDVVETLSLILFQKTRGSAALLLLIFTLLAPMPAPGMSIREYENTPKTARIDKVIGAVDKIIADVAKVNPNLSREIHDYFYVTPKGQSDAPGVVAFGSELVAVEKLAGQGKADLDKIQIEGILLDIVKSDVVNKKPDKN